MCLSELQGVHLQCFNETFIFHAEAEQSDVNEPKLSKIVHPAEFSNASSVILE